MAEASNRAPNVAQTLAEKVFSTPPIDVPGNPSNDASIPRKAFINNNPEAEPHGEHWRTFGMQVEARLAGEREIQRECREGIDFVRRDMANQKIVDEVGKDGKNPAQAWLDKIAAYRKESEESTIRRQEIPENRNKTVVQPFIASNSRVRFTPVPIDDYQTDDPRDKFFAIVGRLTKQFRKVERSQVDEATAMERLKVEYLRYRELGQIDFSLILAGGEKSPHSGRFSHGVSSPRLVLPRQMSFVENVKQELGGTVEFHNTFAIMCALDHDGSLLKNLQASMRQQIASNGGLFLSAEEKQIQLANIGNELTQARRFLEAACRRDEMQAGVLCKRPPDTDALILLWLCKGPYVGPSDKFDVDAMTFEDDDE